MSDDEARSRLRHRVLEPLMEVIACHDCEVELIFTNGLPAGAQLGVCNDCGTKRRRREASKADFAGFSREASPILIDGKTAAVSMVKRY